MKTVLHYVATPNKLLELLDKYKENEKTITYNSLSDTFAVAITVEQGYYDYCITILADLRDEYNPSDDTFNALNEAISALKTLADIENKGE